MPDTERKVLRGHQARTVPRVPAWIALLIGLGLIAGWELEVHGEAEGVDFDATFLLPVYAQGASG